jgi:hypothetical protein
MSSMPRGTYTEQPFTAALTTAAWSSLIPSNGTWTEKALHWFKESRKGGSNPDASLVLDKSGNVYGTPS